jgi:hypothetical protein
MARSSAFGRQVRESSKGGAVAIIVVCNASVVGVAQLVEHRTVAPTVAGSIPVSHPKSKELSSQFWLVWQSHCSTEGNMSSLKEFRCEICGAVSENPVRWFVIECTDQKLAVIKWDLTAASSSTARHFCGEAHAQVYISRWFESVCVPPRRSLKVV